MISASGEQDEESFIPSTLLDSDDDADELSRDWSHIAKLCKSQVVVPKRGEKDYEPDGTDAQEMLLYRAKKAMFDSLSDAARGAVVKNLIKAYYVPELHRGFVSHPKGSFMHTMGRVDRDGVCWLTFHEFVYLAERGTISPYFKRADRQDHELDPPMSIQDLYLLFKSPQECDDFLIYAHLKRLGFIVMNTPEATLAVGEPSSKLRPRTTQTLSSLAKEALQFLRIPTYHPLQFHLTRYTTSGQIYEALNKLVPFYAATKTSQSTSYEECNKSEVVKYPKFTFDVWKPRGSFKKKTPGLPDFQILILNKNSSDYKFPTYSEMKLIFANLSYDAEELTGASKNGKPTEGLSGSKKDKRFAKQVPPHIEQQRRLKKGYRSFVLAVMDDGLTSFVKITEADFGSENVWFKPSSQLPKARPKIARGKMSDASRRSNI